MEQDVLAVGVNHVRAIGVQCSCPRNWHALIGLQGARFVAVIENREGGGIREDGDGSMIVFIPRGWVMAGCVAVVAGCCGGTVVGQFYNLARAA
ncbi:hypothetical protein Acr_00g0053010 [Actinidia rufa]|uniref:Uncharacterized protein n=1 Tax=Actinidia rufa TaxID=165716 RepID=A0A7J0DL77_9ERIC|nr:hypothetical protein Acr_00g0053010 [Actinidia rufa]